MAMASKWTRFSTLNDRSLTQDRLGPGQVSVLGLLILCILPAGWGRAAESTGVTPSPIAVPSLAISPSPGASVTAGSRLSDDEAKKLLKEFGKAQAAELQALKHRQSVEYQELKASQSARLKEWETREKELRHKYFAEHSKGPDRRAYIKDFIERRKAFHQMLSEERVQRQKSQESRLKAVQEDQALRKREFQEKVKEGERPSNSLWPEYRGY